MTRRFAVFAAGTVLVSQSLAFASVSRIPVQYDAVVDAAYEGEAGAKVEGVPTYRTVAAALAAPSGGLETYSVFIRKGRYREKLSVDQPGVHLVGESRDETIITYDASGDTPSPDGKTLGTRGSFTLRVTAPDFVAENLTIENSFDYPGNALKSDDDPSKVKNPQAVAVMTTGSSDRVVFRNCIISGFQDTLFLDAGRHYIIGCRILGHVDFIFGSGQAVFKQSEIVSRPRAGKNPSGYVTAPSTPASMPFGFVFIESRLVKESPDVLLGSVRLGRPWHPNADSTANGSAVFIRCFMDDHIGPEGYAPISGRNAAGERIWFSVGPESRFFEFESFGPGATASDSRPLLPEAAARLYTSEHVLADWRPQP